MQGNGPMNRKKKVTGTASEESMQTHGPGMGTGPVGDQNGYQDRKEQQGQSAAGRGNATPVGNPQAPLNRPKQVTGAATGSMNTHGTGMGASPQQQRPQAGSSQQARPNPYMGQQASPFQNQQRPQQSRPVQQSAPQQRPQQSQQQPFVGGGRPASSAPANNTSQTTRASSGKRSPILILIIIAAVVLLGGGGGLSGLFGGGSSNNNSSSSSSSGVSSLLGGLMSEDSGSSSSTSSGAGSLLGGLLGGDSSSSTSSGAGDLLGGLLGGDSGSSSGVGSLLSGMLSGYGTDALQNMLGGSWFSSQTGLGASQSQSNAYSYNTSVPLSSYTGTLNRKVAAGSRDKYTTVLGGGRDKVTVMVYVCGADLESRSGMATRDLQEMANATFGNNLRLIVYTGGSTGWKVSQISNRVNQIWQIANGKMTCLEENAGTGAMTDPATLTSFIKYGAKNFKANRYALILWDHGSGSVSGYGYDERNPRSGSMSLAGLDQAFRSGGIKFDFIGFDTCLMGNVENALMCSKYADYLIASEETEPGIGWYYTDWLTAWGGNTSMETLDIGKQICDDFVAKCATSCRGQQTTLSLIDLAELEHTVPSKLKSFSQSVTSLVSGNQYKTVSNARNGSREFGTSARVDMVDLTDLCNKLNTTESAALAKTLQSAIKYNRTGNISSAYGLSIYFPYQKMSNVDKAVTTYAAIGMDDSYAQAIRAFASVEASGQAVSGSYGSAIPSLFGMLGGDSGYSSSSSSSSSSSDLVGELLSSFLGGSFGRVAGLDSGNASFLSGRAMDDQSLTVYLTSNYLDQSQLVFQPDGSGNYVLDMKPEQWALVTGVDQNVFYDNGAGYVDLGMDNLFTFDESCRMVADMDGTWVALNGQPVPYYRESVQVLDDKVLYTGRVPALLNGNRVDLLIVFDGETGEGYLAGARAVYSEDETEMVAKAMEALQDGDTLVFLADLYDYDQNYIDSYHFGNPITVQGEVQVGNVILPDASKMLVTYRFTDIYNQAFWTPVIGK